MSSWIAGILLAVALGLKPGQTFKFDFPGRPLDTLAIRNIDSTGRFQAYFTLRGLESGGGVSVFRDGRTFARFWLETAGGKWTLKDSDNDLHCEVEGQGPFFIRNLVVSGKLVQKDSVPNKSQGQEG